MHLFLFWQCMLLVFGQNLNRSRTCHYQESIHLDKCGHRHGELQRYENRNLNKVDGTHRDDYHHQHDHHHDNIFVDEVRNISHGKCNYIEPCRPLFHVARIRRQSLASKISCKVADMLQRCCNMECTKYHQEDVEPPLDQMNDTKLRQFDVIYPVYAIRSTKEMFGFYFIPVYSFPHAYFYTLEEAAVEKVISILYAILAMWKLLVVCLLTCLFASFVIWITELWDNAEEFPRPFIRGILEGFWWGFVSMTTVGYGDKAPKSLLGRLFSIFWILLGITLTSIYVAALVTKFSLASRVDSDLDGKTVGVLKNRLYDSVMTAQHGGKITFVDFNSTLNGFVDLMKMLKRKEIDGFLTARQTYYYYLREIEKKNHTELRKQVENIFIAHYRKYFVRDEMVGGMLMKNYNDYMYFKHYISSNWLQIQTCYAADLNYKNKEFDHHDNSDTELFLVFLYISLALTLAMICFGVFYEKTGLFGKISNHVKREITIDITEDNCSMEKI